MKIDTDLRAAIRAAYTVQKISRSNSWQVKRAQTVAAIRAFVAKPAVSKNVEAAHRALIKAKTLSNAAHQVFASLGITAQLDEISDAAKFARAGGTPVKAEDPIWTFDQVMAQLAAADEKQGRAILKRLGINWS